MKESPDRLAALWQCTCGVFNSSKRSVCSVCDKPYHKEVFDDVKPDEDTKILKAVEVSLKEKKDSGA